MFFSSKPKINKVKEKILNNPVAEFTLKDIFNDHNLAQVVANSLNTGVKNKLTLNDLNNIHTLNASGLGITDLSGIEFLNNLQTANFSNNNISKLPNYTDNNPYLYKNKDTLVLMDLSNNPFLNPNNLFSLDATENRTKFLDQFEDKISRFKLGEVKDRIYPKGEINPYLIRQVINKLLPRDLAKDRNQEINKVFLKYLVGKKIFYNQEPYKGKYILNGLNLSFDSSIVEPNYINKENELIINQLIEELIPEDDLYLIRSIINNKNNLVDLDSKKILDYFSYYIDHPTEISTDYVLDQTGWKQKKNYKDLKESSLSSEDEQLLNSIQNPVIKQEFERYLQYEDILRLYENEHPEKAVEVNKMINKNDDLIKEFLNKYIDLEKNAMLTEQQRNTIQKAEESIKTFNQNYQNQATSLFEQDVFGLEVEMKYIDMLAEADRKIG